MTLFAFLILLCSGNSFAFVSPAPVLSKPADEVSNPKPSPFAGMTVQDFLSLTPKKYRELTGKKMKFSQKVSLKIAQYKVKRMVKQNKNIDVMKFTPQVETSDFNIGGFVLGLILGIIGVLIAYLIGDRSVIKWAWLGLAVWAAIVLLVLIL